MVGGLGPGPAFQRPTAWTRQCPCPGPGDGTRLAQACSPSSPPPHPLGRPSAALARRIRGVSRCAWRPRPLPRPRLWLGGCLGVGGRCLPGFRPAPSRLAVFPGVFSHQLPPILSPHLILSPPLPLLPPSSFLPRRRMSTDCRPIKKVTERKKASVLMIGGALKNDMECILSDSLKILRSPFVVPTNGSLHLASGS